MDVACRLGPPSVLSKEEEDALAKYIIDMVKMGFGLSREDVMCLAFVIAERSGKKHPFHDDMAGRRWLMVFETVMPTLHSAHHNHCHILGHLVQILLSLKFFL